MTEIRYKNVVYLVLYLTWLPLIEVMKIIPVEYNLPDFSHCTKLTLKLTWSSKPLQGYANESKRTGSKAQFKSEGDSLPRNRKWMQDIKDVQ